MILQPRTARLICLSMFQRYCPKSILPVAFVQSGSPASTPLRGIPAEPFASKISTVSDRPGSLRAGETGKLGILSRIYGDTIWDYGSPL